jgi:hypothetical protein
MKPFSKYVMAVLALTTICSTSILSGCGKSAAQKRADASAARARDSLDKASAAIQKDKEYLKRNGWGN